MFSKNRKISENRPQAKLFIIAWVLTFICFSHSVYSKDLTQYKENIQHLKKDFASILAEDFDKESKDNVFREIPTLLPPEEKIDVDGTSIDVNNKWLSLEVADYKGTEDKREKTQILNGIHERLEAIEIKIIELEEASETKVSKDEEKRKLAEILQREEFQKPADEGELSLLQRFLNWLDEWMRKNAPKSSSDKPMPASNLGGVAQVMQYALYALLIGLFGFLIYKFAPFFIKKYREREKEEKTEQIILGEKISADDTSSNLFSEAEELAAAGNLRDAIRMGYIAFLFELNERKLIGLAKHKTNRDYLSSVRKKRELYKNMNGLTLNYERHWYGFENADENDWQEFKENYNEALNE